MAFAHLREISNKYLLDDFNVTIARQVALSSQLRLRYEQSAKLVHTAQNRVERCNIRLTTKDEEIAKLKEEVSRIWSFVAEVPYLRAQLASLQDQVQTEVSTKETTQAQHAAREAEMKSLHDHLAALRGERDHALQQVAELQAKVQGEARVDAALAEFKKQEEAKSDSHAAALDKRLDKLNIDFDEELYPSMLTTNAGRRWMISRGARLTVLKCAESLELRTKFAAVVNAGISQGFNECLLYSLSKGYDMEAEATAVEMEGYDPEADAKLSQALEALRDMSYPVLDELEKNKDAPVDVLMVGLTLRSDTGPDASPAYRGMEPHVDQLVIPIYSKEYNVRNPWAVEREMSLTYAIAKNRSRAERKRKIRVVCRTHGVGSAHHSHSDGIPIFVPTVPRHGLGELLTPKPKFENPSILRRINSLPWSFSM